MKKKALKRIQTKQETNRHKYWGRLYGHGYRDSIKLFKLGIRTQGGLFLGVWYARSIDFRRFRMPRLLIFGVILGLLEATKIDV